VHTHTATAASFQLYNRAYARHRCAYVNPPKDSAMGAVISSDPVAQRLKDEVLERPLVMEAFGKLNLDEKTISILFRSFCSIDTDG
jgi:hypothetical protein